MKPNRWQFLFFGAVMASFVWHGLGMVAPEPNVGPVEARGCISGPRLDTFTVEAEAGALRARIALLGHERLAAIITAGIGHSRPNLTPVYKRTIALAMVDVSYDTGVPVEVIVAIARTESNFDQKAVGSCGEVSLMQIKPFPNRPMKRIRADPAFAIRWGIVNLYLPAPTVELGLMKYNGGHDRRAYAKRVRARAMKYQQLIEIWK